MAQFTPITATNYNSIRTAIFFRYGYGNPIRSLPVTGGNETGVSDIVTSEQQRDLFLDLQSVYVHQNNATTTNPATQLADFDAGTVIEYSDVTDLETIQASVTGFDDSSPFNFPEESFANDNIRTTGGGVINSTRESSADPWGSTVDTISHRVTITFSSSQARSAYFNSGGLIEWTGTVFGGTSATSTTKDGDWKRIIDATGTLRIGRRINGQWIVYSTGQATISYDSLTMSSSSTISGGFLSGGTTVYSINGGFFNPTFGQNIYSNNQFRLVMSVPNSTQIILEAVFDDSDQGTGGQLEGVNDPVDEDVTATIDSEFRNRYADSQFSITEGGVSTTYEAVQNDPPTGVIDKNL